MHLRGAVVGISSSVLVVTSYRLGAVIMKNEVSNSLAIDRLFVYLCLELLQNLGMWGHDMYCSNEQRVMLSAFDVDLMKTWYLSSLAIDRLLDYDCHHSMIHLSLWHNLVEDESNVGYMQSLDLALQVWKRVVLMLDWVWMVSYRVGANDGLASEMICCALQWNGVNGNYGLYALGTYCLFVGVDSYLI